MAMKDSHCGAPNQQSAAQTDTDWATFPDDDTTDGSNWTNFSNGLATSQVVNSSTPREPTRIDIRQCFPEGAPGTLANSSSGWLEVDKSFWLLMCQEANQCTPPLSSKLRETQYPSVDLPVDSEGFDWSVEVSMEIAPSLFRPTKPESPVDINFDHNRAAMGLASLSLDELQCMNEEMGSKFNCMSCMLVEGLQVRDHLAQQLEIKNTFVSAILRVQSLRLTNGGDETRGGRKGGWSLKQPEDKQSRKYLDSVIPYTCPERLQWKSDVLQALTKILHAIADNSDKVPSLVAEYIQEHILESSTSTDNCSQWTLNTNSECS